MSQPAGEEDMMSQQKLDEIKARLFEAVDTNANYAAAILRGRLARASRPSARAVEAMRNAGI